MVEKGGEDFEMAEPVNLSPGAIKKIADLARGRSHEPSGSAKDIASTRTALEQLVDEKYQAFATLREQHGFLNEETQAALKEHKKVKAQLDEIVGYSEPKTELSPERQKLLEGLHQIAGQEDLPQPAPSGEIDWKEVIDEKLPPRREQ